MGFVSSGPGNGIHLSSDVAAKLGRREQCDYLIFLHGLDGLRHQGHEALATHAYVFIIVVRTIDREIVATRAQPVDGKLSGGTHARTNTRARHAAKRLRRWGYTPPEHSQIIKKPA